MTQFPGSLIDIAIYLPEQVVTNSAFAKSQPEWRVEQTEKKTGVFERRTARDDETAYDLALEATRKLLAKHEKLAGKIDAIVFCTQSPDYIMPSNAFLLQRDLGLGTGVLAFDYNLACSGYVVGILIASSFIKTGIARNVLLVTADTYSKYLDHNDRATMMLFGDGASASWIAAPGESSDSRLITSFDDIECGSDGKGWDKFIIKSGGMRHPPAYASSPDYFDKISMNGMQVVNLVNHQIIKHIFKLLNKHKLSPQHIDQFFLHQASGLAISAISKKLNVGPDKVYINIGKIGNTVSSSLPILIHDYFSVGSLGRGSKVMLCGFGVGFSWGNIVATI
jgi:3-oxoacyl-[acyl-carrier-protein] synthase-3